VHSQRAIKELETTKIINSEIETVPTWNFPLLPFASNILVMLQKKMQFTLFTVYLLLA